MITEVKRQRLKLRRQMIAKVSFVLTLNNFSKVVNENLKIPEFVELFPHLLVNIDYGNRFQQQN